MSSLARIRFFETIVHLPQWNKGELYPIDIPYYNDNDYD